MQIINHLEKVSQSLHLKMSCLESVLMDESLETDDFQPIKDKVSLAEAYLVHSEIRSYIHSLNDMKMWIECKDYQALYLEKYGQPETEVFPDVYEVIEYYFDEGWRHSLLKVSKYFKFQIKVFFAEQQAMNSAFNKFFGDLKTYKSDGHTLREMTVLDKQVNNIEAEMSHLDTSKVLGDLEKHFAKMARIVKEKGDLQEILKML